MVRPKAVVTVVCNHCLTNWDIECNVKRADDGHIRLIASSDDRLMNLHVMSAHVGPMTVVLAC